MPPQSKSDGFLPKWRHFHPQATIWVHNPFDHDVVFNVADEHNNPFSYRMPSGKTSELPGGAVATLGVKAIVDELIQSSEKDVFHMWEAAVRAKYEDQIILRIKEAPASATPQQTGEVNLEATAEDLEDDEDSQQVEVDDKPVFPDEPSAPEEPEAPLDPELSNIAAQSTSGKADTVIEE